MPMMIEHILTPAAIRLVRSATLKEAAILMRDRHVGTVIITEEGASNRLVGIVTDRDIAIHVAAEGRSPTSCIVDDVMTLAVATVPRNAPVSEALELMRKRGLRRLVVVDEAGKLAGVISLDDIIDALSTEFAAVGEVLRSELGREIASTSE